MKRERLILVIIGVLLAAAGLFATGGSDRTDPSKVIYVSVAASMAGAMERLAKDFEENHGIQVRLDLGSSGLLRRKIEVGLRIDVFVSASARDMDLLAESGFVMSGTRRQILRNKLVCIVGKSSAVPLADAGDLLSDNVRRIAIGDPAHVPAGIYAKQSLEYMGLWPRLRSKFIRCIDARSALVQVKTGTVAAAIVYASDIRSNPAVKLAFAFPPASHADIIYPACVLKNSPQPDAAKAFVDFLSSDYAATVFAAYDFTSIHGGLE